MNEANTINTVMRTLADPTRRAVFERIVKSNEITVSELTQGSGVTQGAISQHIKSLKQAGLIAERPEGRRRSFAPAAASLIEAAGGHARSGESCRFRRCTPLPGDAQQLLGALSAPEPAAPVVAMAPASSEPVGARPGTLVSSSAARHGRS